MANKLISQMGLPNSIANVFAARNILTAKDALSLTEFELMELLDIGLAEVTTAITHISEIVCPPHQTALLLLEQGRKNEYLGGHLPTRLNGLDSALCGGIPFGVVTELVGPAGIGKTQFCLKLSLLASLPLSYGGLDGHVVYIDTESKFSSRRMIEIGFNSFPELFQIEGMAQKMAGRILVLQPASLTEFSESLEKIKVFLLQHHVKLLVIDSMAALVSGQVNKNIPSKPKSHWQNGYIFKPIERVRLLGVLKLFSWECGQGHYRQHPLGWHIAFIKSLAEFSRIPVVVTNQVRCHSGDESFQYSFQVQSISENQEYPTTFDSHLVAALGISWAHAVSIRLVLESRSGQRFIKLAKSSVSPPVAFPFTITTSGITLLDDYGVEMSGPEINTICGQGQSGVINFDNDT